MKNRLHAVRNHRIHVPVSFEANDLTSVKKSETIFYKTQEKMMKYILFLSILCISGVANAKNYYISATGNDANSGTSTSSPWKTINKVNSYFASMAAGDSILFKRGETFYGTIKVNKSGTSTAPIVIGAYGTGAMPVISGMTSVSSWTSAGTNLWKSNTLSNKDVSLLTINNALKPKGRYPNANAANGGYLKFEAVSGTTSVTDNELPSSPNWTGGTIVLKPNPWTIKRCPITAQSGGTLTFSGNSTSIRNNYGYFIQDHISVLDQQYEWYYNKSAKQLTMYSSSTPSGVKVSSTDTLCLVYNKSYITIKGLQFDGAGGNAILLNTTTGITIDGCTITSSGGCGIFVKNSKSPVIQNSTIYNSYDIGIDLGDINNASAIVKNNSIKRSGADPGAGGTTMSGLCMTGNGHTITNNTIDSSGYAGIDFQRGSNLTIKNNVINTYCFVKSDGGGIYTWNNTIPTATTYTNNKIIGNIVMNGVGVMYGTTSTVPDADGIFMDDNTSNVEITDNTVFNVAGAGIYIHNNFNMNVQRNTFYNNGREQVNFTHNPAYVNGSLSPYTTPIRNVTFKHNIMFATTAAQDLYTHYSILDDIGSTGPTDSNYYCRPSDETKTFNIMKNLSGTTTSKTYDLTGWKTAYTSKDQHSKKAAVSVSTTTSSTSSSSTVTPVGSNLVTNGDFLTSITGISAWSPNNNQIVSLDLLSKITGTGSLKVSFPTAVSGTYTSLYTTIGAVSSSKQYLLRFKTLGTTSNGSLRVYLRQRNSPFNSLTPMQSISYSTSKTTQEFVFSAPTTEATACVMIELNQNSGTTYLDDIEFYEATTGTSGDTAASLRFEYNPTASSKTVSLGAEYTSVEGTVYNGSITLAPYTSKILIWTGATTATRPAATTDTVQIVAAERPAPAAIETASALKIMSFPNPSSTAFTLLAEGKTNERIIVTVYNTEGKIVYQNRANIYDRLVFGNNFSAGMYVVKVVQGTDVQTLKLIKTQQ